MTDAIEKARIFQQLLHTIFELYLPNDKDTIKLGNVTFTNDKGQIWQDLPGRDWATVSIAEDILKILKERKGGAAK